MLVFNRKVGQSIHLGDEVCLTVFDKLRYHVTLGIVAPATANVRLGAAEIRPAVLDDGAHFYMLSLLSGDAFSVDEVEIRVKFRSSGLSALGGGSNSVRIAIHAPAHIAVHRSEVYERFRSVDDRRASALAVANWLFEANKSVSHRPTGMPARPSSGANDSADAEFIFV
jgi:sRNA-binding carbon storage regulator CsrA